MKRDKYTVEAVGEGMSRAISDEEVTDRQLFTWWREWRYQGREKGDIERRELRDTRSNGKRITYLWRDRIGKETERVHRLVQENRKLRFLVISCGVDPDTMEDL